MKEGRIRRIRLADLRNLQSKHALVLDHVVRNRSCPNQNNSRRRAATQRDSVITSVCVNNSFVTT